MPAGFRSRTEAGTIQLSNDSLFFSLVAKGVIPVDAGWAADGPTGEAIFLSTPGIPDEDQPLIALHCATLGTWARRTTMNGQRGYQIIKSGGSAPIEWFIYSLRRPTITAGPNMILRDDSNNMVYSARQPALSPMGVIDQNGYAGIPVSGRKCAHVPVLERVRTARAVSYGGLGSCMQGGSYPGYSQYFYESWSYSMTFAGNGDVGARTRSSQIGPYPTGACMVNSTSPTTSSTFYPNYQSLIVDVTNV